MSETKSEEVKKLIKKGLEALKKNKPEKALEFFDQAIRIDHKDPISWNNKGVALRKLGSIVEAIHCYNRALSLKPDLVIALLNRAKAFKSQKKFAQALSSCESVLELVPAHQEALEEIEKIKAILSRRAQLEVIDRKKQESERRKFKERREELLTFLEESRKSISDSINKIQQMFDHKTKKEEAKENSTRIIEAIVAFNEQLLARIKRTSEEFASLDFQEECCDLLANWSEFKEQQLEKLRKMT